MYKFERKGVDFSDGICLLPDLEGAGRIGSATSLVTLRIWRVHVRRNSPLSDANNDTQRAKICTAHFHHSCCFHHARGCQERHAVKRCNLIRYTAWCPIGSI
eukprot:Skav227245  [mRNA]  locus=scaffold2789:208161:208466:- [translate_table: standard]